LTFGAGFAATFAATFGADFGFAAGFAFALTAGFARDAGLAAGRGFERTAARFLAAAALRFFSSSLARDLAFGFLGWTIRVPGSDGDGNRRKKVVILAL
jgi:hypothetical protein